MSLQRILRNYHGRFMDRYGHTLTNNQRSALNALIGCRTGQYGDTVFHCHDCSSHMHLPRACGHRSCNQCQSQSTQQWLDRQLQKQLPVDYYMVTFTLPYELRHVAMRNPKTVYTTLLKSATRILKRFGLNHKHFHAELGMCAVLHTHTRKLDYHPHVHIVIPGGGIDRARRQWRKIKGNYLFNGRALATAFRGEMLHQLAGEQLAVPQTPKRWIVQCQKVGRGKQALQYLSRYLYRGVITNKNIINDDGQYITFRYKESKTNAWKTRTMTGEAFISLLLQHVLPKGFRRARDYGFLHGNAKAIRHIIQWVFKVSRPPLAEKRACNIQCPQCGNRMQVIGTRPARASPA